ncbi:MAG: 16S rRNA methyltransferase [Anaerolineae bacterium]|nr:16S rRNA methyltransferase [Anaerolineae bacterium]MDH7472853.1 16S rRNA methyltransferase [Anaerolineae bacterium]
MTDVDEIVRTVLATRKYRSVCLDTVWQIARRELVRHGDLKKALKGTKSRLHQFYGAFEREMDYEAAISHLDAAFKTGSGSAIEETCREILRMHQSTAERLPILDEFYAAIWTLTGVPHSLLDLACGLNPLTLSWMHLPVGAQYFAFDIDVRRIAFLNRFFLLAGFPPLATWQDIVCHPPQTNADVALLLKTSPTLERQEKGSTRRLLQALKTPFVVVSFSVKSLGGREKGMPAHYERAFLAMMKDEPWQVSKLTFETELVFVIGK